MSKKKKNNHPIKHKEVKKVKKPIVTALIILTIILGGVGIVAIVNNAIGTGDLIEVINGGVSGGNSSNGGGSTTDPGSQGNQTGIDEITPETNAIYF